MKIVHIIGYFQPELGYEEYYSALTQAKMGHDVSVITSDRIYPFKNIEKILQEIGSEYTGRKRWVGMKVVDGIKVYRLPVVFESFYDFILVMGVRKILSQIKPDIVHSHGVKQGTQMFAAMHKDLGYKLVIDEHDTGPTYSQEPTFKNNVARFEYFLLRKRICSYGYKRADSIVAVTPQARDFLMSLYKIKKNRIELLPLGVNTDIFKVKKAKGRALRRSMGISDNDILIITAGRVDRAKKLELLIEAFAKLNKKYEGLRLLMIGRGDDKYSKYLKDLVKKLKITDSVIFRGFIRSSELPGYYSASDIGFWGKESITIIEAMACGLPVVIADLGTIRHLVEFDNGFTFKPGELKEIRHQLENLVADKELRTRMKKNSLKAVKNKFSYDVRTKKLLKIYEKTLAGKGN
jgi:glycosyltransferase involved in cell wall biosynthesis